MSKHQVWPKPCKATGVQVTSLPSLARARSIVDSDQPPQAVYVEDTEDAAGALGCDPAAAQSRQVPVLVGLQSVGLMHMSDFYDAGLRTPMRAMPQRWLAGSASSWRAQAGRRRPGHDAIAGAKGGIGKTLVVAMLAEGLKRRG